LMAAAWQRLVELADKMEDVVPPLDGHSTS
jgi:hypothetical protein